jgi:hypothetical protein
MTNEQYLRRRGWSEFEGDRPGLWMRDGGRGRPTAILPLAEAVETQLAEDRACYNFVRARTRMYGGFLWPQDEPTDDIAANRPKEPR